MGDQVLPRRAGPGARRLGSRTTRNDVRPTRPLQSDHSFSSPRGAGFGAYPGCPIDPNESFVSPAPRARNGGRVADPGRGLPLGMARPAAASLPSCVAALHKIRSSLREATGAVFQPTHRPQGSCPCSVGRVASSHTSRFLSNRARSRVDHRILWL